jgi:putative toxin-antitoxin system antitoxin component (TIGR02293 family)
MEAILQIYEVLGGDRVLGRKIHSPFDLDEAVKHGLPFSAFELVCKKIALSGAEAIELVASSSRTMARRKARHQRLNATESDRLARLARIYARALDVLEDEEKARRWLHKPNRSLGGRVPLKVIDTDIGSLEVERVLGRLEHGIFG